MTTYTDSNVKKTISGTNEVDYIVLDNVTKKTTVKANAGNDTIDASMSTANMTFYAGMGSDSISTSDGKNTVYCGSGSTVVRVNTNSDTVIYPQNSKLEIDFTGVGINSTFFDEANYVSRTNEYFEERFKRIKNDIKIMVNEDCSFTIKDYYKNNGEITIKTSNGEVDFRNFFYNYVMTEDKKYKITGTSDYDIIKTQNKNDTIYGGAGNDAIEGNGGNDVIYGQDGDDTIKGGEGNDKLYGGKGYNFYEFDGAQMQGNDTIYIENGSTSDIRLSTYISASYKSGNNLILEDDNGNKVTLANFYKAKDFDVRINGSSFDSYSNITGKGTIKDTHFNDGITGSKSADKIYTTGGVNSVEAGKGNDKIYHTGDGQTHLTFRAGDGKDTLYGNFEQAYFYNGYDMYATNIDPSSCTMRKSGNHLIINYTAKDSITLNNYFLGETSIAAAHLQYVINNYQNTLDIPTLKGNIKFYSMPTNNTINLGQDIDTNTLTVKQSGNNLIVWDVRSPKNKITFVDYFKDGYDVTINTLSESHSLNALILEASRGAYNEIGCNGGDFSGRGEGWVIPGTTVNDSITGTSYYDYIIAGAGHDTIDGHGGEDTILGGTGNDIINVTSGAIHGDAGNDTITSGSGDDLIYGGSDDDSINAGSGNDKVYGDSGNDYIDAGMGRDTVYGGAGNDTIVVAGSYSQVYGDKGNDNISSTAACATLKGGAGNDEINVSSFDCKVYGDAGNDYIEIGSGHTANYINGGSGNDTIYDIGNNSEIEDSSGNDLYTLAGSDTEVEDKKGNDIYEIQGQNIEIEDDKGNDKYTVVRDISLTKKLDIDDSKGNDTLSFRAEDSDSVDFIFDVTVNKKGAIVNKGDIDLFVINKENNYDFTYWFNENSMLDRVEIDNYFGGGCIEKIEFNDGSYVTKTQLNAVLQEVATWLHTNNYSSVSQVISSGDYDSKTELVTIFENINWQK